MRICTFVVATAVLALAYEFGVSGDSHKKEKPDRVANLITELIKDLGHDDFAKREAASKELSVLGVLAFDSLRKAAATNGDLEIRRRAEKLIGAIGEAERKKVDKSLVNETAWHVSGFERGLREAPHPVPWVFHSNGTVQAGDLWRGTWQPAGKNAVLVTSPTDECLVYFLSPHHFVATKGEELYRQGKRADAPAGD